MEMSGKLKKTAIYVRQSLDKKDSLSIEDQTNLCKRECENGEYVVYEDRGFSGKSLSRPAFHKLLADVENETVKKIICYRLDRISRNISDFGRIWEMLSKKNVEFVSVSEKFDTETPIGRAMLYIIMVFAQLERETIAGRISDNYHERLKRGSWPGGPAPFGFSLDKSTKGGKKNLMPNPELSIVEEIFNLYHSSQLSLRELASLIQKKYPSAKKWSGFSISRILKSPVYVKCDEQIYFYYQSLGTEILSPSTEFDGRRGGIYIETETEKRFSLLLHDGIVPSSVFLSCQEKLKKNRQIKNSGRGRHSFLSGLLKCDSCGYGIKIQKDSRSESLYLVCTGREKNVCALRHSESIKAVESYVSSELERKLPKTDYKALHQKNLNYQTIETQISLLISALSKANECSAKYIHSEIERLHNMKNELMRPEKPLSKPPPFHELPFDEQKLMAKTYISKIHVSPDGVKIDWK